MRRPPAIPTHSLDLGERPRISQTGLCLHGTRAAESFRLHRLWSLHAYHYQGELRVGGRTFPFHSGWVSLVPPGALAEWRFPSHAPHHYVHFAVEPAGGVPVALPLLQDLGARFDGFCAALEELGGFQKIDPRRASVRLWDLLYQLCPAPAHAEHSAPLHPSIQIALSLIREQQTASVRVGRIARAMGVSHNHLTGVFKKTYGCGIHAYLQRERLARACHLLAHSSLGIKSIANEIGVPDLHYFNKLIRKRTGLSPRAYRLRMSRTA